MLTCRSAQMPLRSAISTLGEMVYSIKRGGRRYYAISKNALAARRGICPIHPVRGSELDHPRFANFSRAGTGAAAVARGGA